MGLDIYHGFVLGFRVGDYAKIERRILELPRYDENTGERIAARKVVKTILNFPNVSLEDKQFIEKLEDEYINSSVFYSQSQNGNIDEMFFGLKLQMYNITSSSLKLLPEARAQDIKQVMNLSIVKFLQIRDVPKIYSVCELSY